MNATKWIAALAGLTLATAAFSQEKVVFATNWRAQAGHGGFYQALADGTYKKYGLDVEIQQGGPQVNNRPLLATGRIDFLMTGNLLHSFDNVKNKVPTVVVAAMFQKDPQAMLAHPGQGYDKWEDLKKAPTILIGKDGQFSFWQWMKADHGFRDEQLDEMAAVLQLRVGDHVRGRGQVVRGECADHSRRPRPAPHPSWHRRPVSSPRLDPPPALGLLERRTRAASVQSRQSSAESGRAASINFNQVSARPASLRRRPIRPCSPTRWGMPSCTASTACARMSGWAMLFSCMAGSIPMPIRTSS